MIAYGSKTMKYVSLFVLIVCINLFLVFSSPADYKQGELVKIMYIHVPSAWLSLGVYTSVFLASLNHLIRGKGAVFARAVAPCGALFTFLCIVTGSVWGKYTWGAWWVWDARLTSMLFMMLIYVGYIMLWNISQDSGRCAFVTSLFAIFSAINIPIVKFSVDLWATVHQSSSFFRKGGASVDILMQVPLCGMAVLFFLYVFICTRLRMRTIETDEQVRVRLA